jgi:rare lipoprotein A
MRGLRSARGCASIAGSVGRVSSFAWLVASTSMALAACAEEEPRGAVMPVGALPPPSEAPPGQAPAQAPAAPIAATSPAPFQVGLATWYGAALAGHKTASGEPFDPAGMTAAHRTLPLGTWVVVRMRATGRQVTVRINDRGPFGDARRVIDVSRAAADVLGLTPLGVAPVEVWVVAPPR